MIPEHIIECNKLIAGFMNIPFVNGCWKFDTKTAPYSYPYSWPHLLFNKSYDWLMLVVEKINSNDTDCFVTIFSDKCRIHNMHPSKMNDIEIEANTTIKAVWLAVIEFIKWHNANA